MGHFVLISEEDFGAGLHSKNSWREAVAGKFDHIAGGVVKFWRLMAGAATRMGARGGEPRARPSGEGQRGGEECGTDGSKHAEYPQEWFRSWYTAGMQLVPAMLVLAVSQRGGATNRNAPGRISIFAGR